MHTGTEQTGIEQTDFEQTRVPGLVMFAHCDSATERFLPAAEKLIGGHPEQTVRNHYSDASQQFHAGEWTGEPGIWRVRYSEHEFCYITRGRVRITDAAGRETLVQAGDAFMVPAGFSGRWEVLEPTHKFYVIFEAKSA